MPDPFHDIPFEDLRALAERLEAALGKINKKLLSMAGVEEGGVVNAMTDAAAMILRLDEFSKKKLVKAVEEARVQSIARDAIPLACVLTAAVALTEFRKAPLPVAGLAQRVMVAKVVGKGKKALRAISGLPPAVPAFSVAMLYAIAGMRLRDRLRDRKKKPKTLDV